MKYSFTTETPMEKTIDAALRRVKIRRELAEALSCESRAMRQYASCALLGVAEQNYEDVVEFAPEVFDALNRPEPMTRFQALRIINLFINHDARLIDKAFEDIETCLYDEESPNVRGSAFKVLAHYGSTTPKRSEKVWPSLSDAIRCWHRDVVFMDMVGDLITLLEGKCSPRVRMEASELFEFDVNSNDLALKKKAQYIVSLKPEE